MRVFKAKNDVIRAGIELSESGLIARTWGNVSSRTSDNEFVITASGRNYLTLTPEEVIQVKIDDLSYDGKIKPSSEKKVHREIYRLKEDAGFVIHTHQSNASAVSAMGLKEVRFKKEYPGIGNRVLCAGYGLPGTKTLCKNTAEAIEMSTGKAVIMSNHGAVCFGRDFEEAFEVTRALEEACGDYLNSLGVDSWQEGKDNKQLWNDDPVIMKYMEIRDELRPYLDDFAQLVGPKLNVVEYDQDLIDEALSEGIPLLVRGKGALCAAENEDDIEAVSIVIEKNCRAALAAIGCKPIKKWECHLMRQVYLRKYSKLKK